MNQLYNILVPGIGLLIIVMMVLYALSLMSELDKKMQQQAMIEIDSIAWQNARKKLEDTLTISENDFQKTTILREFVAAHADMGNGVQDVENTFADWYKMSIAELFTIFHNDLAAAKCGVISTMLQKLYEDFGYQSVTYDMGAKGTPQTHVTTLVEIKSEGKKVLLPQDATFNYTLVNENEKPLDFFALLAALKARNAEDVLRKESANPIYVESLLSYQDDLGKFIDEHKMCKHKISKTIPATDSTKVHKMLFQRDLNMIFECSHEGEKYLDMLGQRGYPRDFNYLYLLPINGVKGADVDKIQQKMDSILQAN